MTFATAAILLSSLGPQYLDKIPLGADSFLPGQLLTANGFTKSEMIRMMPGSRTGFWRFQSADERGLSLDVVERDVRTTTVGSKYDNAPIDSYAKGTPSGLPLASCYFHATVRYRTRVRLEGLFEGVDLTYRVKAEPNSTDYRSGDRGTMKLQHQLFAELVARHAIARAAGRRLENPTRTAIGGQPCVVMTESRSDRTFVELSDWALARGWSIRTNPDTAVTALTKDDRTILVPLGSRRIKSSEGWQEMGDLVMQVQYGSSTRTFVPLASLEQANTN